MKGESICTLLSSFEFFCTVGSDTLPAPVASKSTYWTYFHVMLSVPFRLTSLQHALNGLAVSVTNPSCPRCSETAMQSIFLPSTQRVESTNCFATCDCHPPPVEFVVGNQAVPERLYE